MIFRWGNISVEYHMLGSSELGAGKFCSRYAGWVMWFVCYKSLCNVIFLEYLVLYVVSHLVSHLRARLYLDRDLFQLLYIMMIYIMNWAYLWLTLIIINLDSTSNVYDFSVIKSSLLNQRKIGLQNVNTRTAKPVKMTDTIIFILRFIRWKRQAYFN